MLLSSYLHPHAQSLALNALSRISGARIQLKLAYQDPPETVSVGEGGDGPGDRIVTVTVYSPELWLKLCSNFDLVCSHLLGEIEGCVGCVLMYGDVGLRGGVYVPGGGL